MPVLSSAVPDERVAALFIETEHRHTAGGVLCAWSQCRGAGGATARNRAGTVLLAPWEERRR